MIYERATADDKNNYSFFLINSNHQTLTEKKGGKGYSQVFIIFCPFILQIAFTIKSD